ncbi:MAG TPA: cation:proton antiporter, partial [Gammaproteobacteria bacterium]|nr:cation:proton antiporter [Gammaproteobacteria bacterium]
ASSSSGVIPSALVALVLAFAALAHVFGAPELLGGFAAGIALSRRFFLPLGLSLHAGPDFDRDVRDQMRPIIQLFTPVFFVMVGLSLDLSAVDWSSGFIWLFSLALVSVAIGGKLLGGLFVNESLYSRVVIGMAMVPRGEVGLIFAELGRTSGVFDAEVYAGIVLVIAYTTLLSPFWIRQYYRRFGSRLGPAAKVIPHELR